jgi:hypothetical protein
MPFPWGQPLIPIIMKCKYCGSPLSTAGESVISCTCSASLAGESAERERQRQFQEQRQRALQESKRHRSDR